MRTLLSSIIMELIHTFFHLFCSRWSYIGHPRFCHFVPYCPTLVTQGSPTLSYIGHPRFSHFVLHCSPKVLPLNCPLLLHFVHLKFSTYLHLALPPPPHPFPYYPTLFTWHLPLHNLVGVQTSAESPWPSCIAAAVLTVGSHTVCACAVHSSFMWLTSVIVDIKGRPLFPEDACYHYALHEVILPPMLLFLPVCCALRRHPGYSIILNFHF